MLEIHGLTPSDIGLYEAIRAQLSAAPLILDRVEIDNEQAVATDPRGVASQAASTNDAAMLFWIEDREVCRLYFYIPTRDGEVFNSRTLDLNLDSSWSRHQIIAIAAASMVEGLLVSHGVHPAKKKPDEQNAALPVVKNVSISRRIGRFEVAAAYAGSLVTAGVVTNGILLGLSARPLPNVLFSASFIQNVPFHFETEEYKTTFVSRTVEIAAAGRLFWNFFELRLGMAWSIDLRSFSTEFSSDRFDPGRDGLKDIHSLAPFILGEWRFSERVGLFTNLGVSFALNETDFKIERLDGPTVELSPFLAKLTYRVGLTIHL